MEKKTNERDKNSGKSWDCTHTHTHKTFTELVDSLERESYSLENSNIAIVSSLVNSSLINKNNSVTNNIISKYKINKTTNKAYKLGFTCCFLCFFLDINILILNKNKDSVEVEISWKNNKKKKA